MFTGIVECTTTAVSVEAAEKTVILRLQRPPEFTDLEIGHSVSVNGVCLTVEELTQNTMLFRLGFETLRVVGWTPEHLNRITFNVERALLVGSRLHGHWVTGHVDGLGVVTSREIQGDCLLLAVQVPVVVRPFVWNKGSITINGVSLTVNRVNKDEIEVCLIPETLRRTQLASMHVGANVCLEADYFAKAIVRYHESAPAQNIRPEVIL